MHFHILKFFTHVGNIDNSQDISVPIPFFFFWLFNCFAEIHKDVLATKAHYIMHFVAGVIVESGGRTKGSQTTCKNRWIVDFCCYVCFIDHL